MLDYTTVYYLIVEGKMSLKEFDEWLDKELCDAFDEALKVDGT